MDFFKKDPRRTGSVMPIAVMAFAIVAFLFMIYLAVQPVEKNATVRGNKNSKTTVNTNIAPTVNSNVVTNTNTAPTNTNGNTNTQSNTNASTTPPSGYTVSILTANPSKYDSVALCVRGIFQNSFEFNAFGSGVRNDSSGQPQLTQPYIWVNQSANPALLTCTDTNRTGQKTCQGTVTLCGTFRYAPPGQPGFGSVAAYRYELE